MQKRLRDLLRVVVADLRHALSGGSNGQRGDLDRELERLGIAPDGMVTPFDALPNPSPAERRARRVAEAQLAAAPAAQRAATRAEVVDRAAYTWINRLLAIRAMEARGLINEILRSDPAYDGLSEALFILRQTQPQRAAGPDGGWWAVIEDACQAQAASLPGLFDLDDPSAALRPSIPALLRCVAIIGAPPTGYTAEEAEATFADPDAIGWAYQFYQEEAKTRTYAKLNSGGKATTRAEIAAITQLFTEPYMVKWLLQNSLGRTYYELYPDSRLPETWEYYVRESANQRISDDSPIRALADLTFMDPCMGSGHFEREAFDMYFVMYREQYPDMGAAEIAERILTRHLHGIDLDPRAAQLTALTLYLRAWELVRDERRAKRLPGPGSYRPPAMNLATTPTGLTPGSLERHLQRHPEDRIYRPLLEGIFAALEQADVLGSLLRPGEQLDAAIRAFRTQGGGQLGLLAEDDDLNRLLGELARHDPAELKRMLLERIARSFAVEAADTDEVAMMLFGREAGKGLQLLQLLDRQYTLVATNPPYVGSKNMDGNLKDYVEGHYRPGKRDLYAALILRCLELCASHGYVAMVTPSTWGTQTAYREFRTVLLASNQLVHVVQLGRHAFGEADPPGYPHLFTIKHDRPAEQHVISSCDLPISMPSEGQATLLAHNCQRGVWNITEQKTLEALPGLPLLLSIPGRLLAMMLEAKTLGEYAEVPKGLSTADNARFLRYFWETPSTSRWFRYAKGGAFARWSGLVRNRIDYQYEGARLINTGRAVIRNAQYYFRDGLTYTEVARGALGVRKLTRDTLFDARSPGVFVREDEACWLDAALNSRPSVLFFRQLSPGILLDQAYAPSIRVILPEDPAVLAGYSRLATNVKDELLASDPTEDEVRVPIARPGNDEPEIREQFALSAILAVAASAIDRLVIRETHLREFERQVIERTGTPSGWHPLLVNYDSVPDLSTARHSVQVPQSLMDDLTNHRRLALTSFELEGIRAALQTLYQAGPGANETEPEESEDMAEIGEDGVASGACIPIPAETFLEELSQKLQIHPISVHWLLEELRAEGVRCKPEELRLLEDRLSVLVLRLLGYRWPRQIEAGELVPSWADPDGIIPLTAIAGETALAERVRGRLRAEDGDRGAQQVEALLRELTGQTLEEWLRRSFFARHVRQFKHRPIAWHLASTPTKDARRKTKAQREPAFECLLYYHACRGDALARLRAHYVEPLIRLETASAADARRRGDETAAALAVSRVQELEEFAARLRDVEEDGFACADLDRLLADEQLDRWSSDGILPPASTDELAAQERTWRVDINDGVRVNVAPLQLSGLLTGDVLRADDARKAIADRARWRSDERRWVREGVLPRCGWMDEDVPESPRWTERAPEREAEQRKLEEKRRAVMERMGRNDGASANCAVK